MIFKANKSQNPIARANLAISTEGPGFGGAKIFPDHIEDAQRWSGRNGTPFFLAGDPILAA